MASKIDIINYLHDNDTQRFERRYSEQKGRQVTLRDIPLKDFVDADTNIFEKKVTSLIIEGATDKADYWRDIVHVYPMTSEVEVVPVPSMRQFKVRRGQFSKTGKQETGGRVAEVTLDVRDEDKERYCYFEIRERDIELKRYNFIAQSLRLAGKAFAKQIRDDILTAYIADKGADVEQPRGTDARSTAVFKLASKMNKKGFGLDTIIIDSDNFTTAITEVVGNTLPWLTAMNVGASITRENLSASIGDLNGLVGYFGGQVPIFVVGDTSATLSGIILGIERMAGEVIGIHKEITVKNEIKSIEDLIANKLVARYDIKKANANGIGWISSA